jgi:preprotein translocase subunit SecF
MQFPLRIIKNSPQIDFVGKRFITYCLSIIITIATIALLFSKGLHLGIDFTGGIILEMKCAETIHIDNFRHALEKSGYAGASIQSDSSGIFMIRVQPRSGINYAEEVTNLRAILSAITNNDIDFRRIDYVGPKVGDSLVTKGVLSLVIALVAIMIYVWIRFDWQFGIGVIVALIHDAIATMGFYIVSGYEFDLTSIAALLTIIGYSVNDSVVIYDRIRENIKKHGRKNIVKLVNNSINETLSRTIMTAATTLVVCLTLVLFGGKAIEGFSAAMLFGIAFGTYSSICISAPIIIPFINKAK